MSKYLPYSGSKLAEPKQQLNTNKMIDDQEVDVAYLKKLHDLHTDFHLSIW